MCEKKEWYCCIAFCYKIYLIDFLLIHYIVWTKEHSFIAEHNFDYMSLTVFCKSTQWFYMIHSGILF